MLFIVSYAIGTVLGVRDPKVNKTGEGSGKASENLDSSIERQKIDKEINIYVYTYPHPHKHTK